MKKALIYLHISIFLWGFTGVLGKLIDMNEVVLVTYRLLFAVITLWALYLFRKEKFSIQPRHYLSFLLAGAVQAMHWVLFFGSINYGNASIALTCLSSAGLFTAINEPLINGRRLQWPELLLGLLAMAGIVIIFHFDPRYQVSIILGVISALLVSFTPVLTKRLLLVYPAQAVTNYSLSGGLLSLLLLMPVYLQFSPTQKFLPAGYDWLWLLVLAWFCTVLTWYLSMQALKKVSAFTMSLLLNLEPVYGILLAFAIYQENKMLNNGFYLGFALILIAVGVQMVRITRRG